MVEGHDLSLCDVVQIHYINVDSSDKTNVSSDVYEVKDLQVSPDSDDVVILSWLISSNATKYIGTLNFAVTFKCVSDDGSVDYVWGTSIFTGISIFQGINNVETAVEDYSDVLEQWRQELFNSPGASDGEDGGYYIPYVSQIDENTMQVSFTASKEGMETVEPQTIALPVGEGVVIPQPTTTDAGKILTVDAYGSTTWAEVTNAEEVAV